MNSEKPSHYERMRRKIIAMKAALEREGIDFGQPDSSYELNGHAARVWWLALLSPRGVSYQDCVKAFCARIAYYSHDGSPNRWSSYVRKPFGQPVHHGAQLSGVLHRMWKAGYLTVNSQTGPRGGRIYHVNSLCQVPQEILRGSPRRSR